MREEQKARIIELLWDSLRRDPEHDDRRQTGWGTKTKEGLIACIDRIAYELKPIEDKNREAKEAKHDIEQSRIPDTERG